MVKKVKIEKLNQFGEIKNIRLILGDQLNHVHSWYVESDASTLYVIAELFDEATYTQHHVQKIHSFFLAMEAFAIHLKETGHQVLHLTLDDTKEIPGVDGLLSHLVAHYEAEKIEYQQPDEYRLLVLLRELKLDGVVIEEFESEHFLVGFDELQAQFESGKKHRMEQFYRRLRSKRNILMENGEPLGGQWNYDATNRKKLKKSDLPEVPAPLLFANETRQVNKRLKDHGIKTIGNSESPLTMPIDRQQSVELLEYFCRYGLPRFGDFQDAMTEHSPYSWSLYHSRLSFSINSKLLSPLEVIEAAIEAYHQDENIDLTQIEGFVRQILGWREFIRGIYWANMPGYAELNHLEASRDLPEFFWSGDTNMNCVSRAVKQSLDHAYAHHIQRLMITGTFSLLAGIDPDQVDDWYLGIYSDAIEWAQMPNTRGMSQFADGGIIASKPYIASGNYINKMSDYCKNCRYDVKDKTSEKSCPFNSLYWNFVDTHRERFADNPRIGMAYRTWDRFDAQAQKAILDRARIYLADLESL